MAIAITVPTAAVATTTNATSYALGAFTPTGNAILVLIQRGTGPSMVQGSVAGGSLNWIRVKGLVVGTSLVEAFFAVTPASPASCTATYTLGGSVTGTGSVLQIFSFTGADLLTPIRQTCTGNATSTNPTHVFPNAMGTNNGYCGVFGNGVNPPAATLPTSWTQNASTGYATPAAGAQGGYRAAGETTTTVTWTLASSTWLSIGVEVNVDASGKASDPAWIQTTESGGFVGQILGG